jgi:hypothetical protein
MHDFVREKETGEEDLTERHSADGFFAVHWVSGVGDVERTELFHLLVQHIEIAWSAGACVDEELEELRGKALLQGVAACRTNADTIALQAVTAGAIALEDADGNSGLLEAVSEA